MICGIPFYMSWFIELILWFWERQRCPSIYGRSWRAVSHKKQFMLDYVNIYFLLV